MVSLYPKIQLIRSTLLFSSAISLTSLNAQQEEVKNEPNMVDQTHSYVSKRLMVFTNWFDSFFGTKQSLEEQNQSRIRVYHLLSRGEKGPINQSPGYNVQLRFPNLQKRVQLNFEKEASNETDTPSLEENQIESNPLPPDTDFRGGLSFFWREVYRFNFKLSAGVKVSLDPTPYANFRISRNFIYNKKTKSHLILETFWDKKNNYGQNASFDLNRKLNDTFLFRFANDFTWLDDTDTISASHGPTLFHRINHRMALSYNIRAGYANRPDYRVQSYNFSITFRQNLYKDWFYYDLTPFLAFNRSSNFRREPGASFKLEVSVGNF